MQIFPLKNDKKTTILMLSKFILSHHIFLSMSKQIIAKKSNWSASQKYIHAKIKKFEFPIYNISREENCKQLSLPKTTAAYQKNSHFPHFIFRITSFAMTDSWVWLSEREWGILRAYTASYDLQHTRRKIFDDFSHDYVYITPIDVVVIIGWVMSTWTSLTFYCHTHVCMSWQEVKIIKILNNLTLAIPW